MIKKILLILTILLPVITTAQELMNKNFEGFRIKASEVTVGYDTINAAAIARWNKYVEDSLRIKQHLLNDLDTVIGNEYQNLSNSKNGNNITLNISNGTGTTFSVADEDSSTTNELQTISTNGNAGNITLSNLGNTLNLNVNDHSNRTALDNVSGVNTGDQTSVSGQAGYVSNSITFNNSGTGDASGATFNGSAAKTVSSNTIGALNLNGGTMSNQNLVTNLNADMLDGYDYSHFMQKGGINVDNFATGINKVTSWNGSLPDGLSAYNYGLGINFNNNQNEASIEIYVPEVTLGSTGDLWYRSGWGVIKRNWTKIWTNTTLVNPLSANSSTFAANRLIKATGSCNQVQETGITVDGSNNVYGVNSLRADLSGEGTSFILTGAGSNFQVIHDNTNKIKLYNSSGGGFNLTTLYSNVSIEQNGNLTAPSATLTTGAFSGSILTGDASGNISHSTINQAIGGNALSSGYLPYWDGSKLANSGLNISGVFSERYNISNSQQNGVAIILESTNATGRKYAIGSNYVAGNGEFSIYDYTENQERLQIGSSGQVKINNLSGIGTRPIGATSDGTLTPISVTQVTFTQTANQTVGNTTTETTMFGSGVGSLSIPANTLIVGRTYRIKLKGYASGTNGDTSTLKVKLGSVELVSSVGTWQTLTDIGFTLEFDFTCRTTGTTGTVAGNGYSLVSGGQGFSTVSMRALLAGTDTIDTTIDNLIDLTYQWSSTKVGNTITITNASVEVLN